MMQKNKENNHQCRHYSTRTLESIYQVSCLLKLVRIWAIFIYPGYQFQVVDQLITNFHLPKSTLIMLVSAFSKLEYVKHAYQRQ